VQVERTLDISSVEFTKEILRIREEFLLPGPACPADASVKLISSSFSTWESLRGAAEQV
jgi:hypothetical protein